MSTKKRVILILVCLYLGYQFIPELKLAKVTVKLVDEEGKPVENAMTGLIFKYGHLTKDSINGYTDRDGEYSVCSRTPDGTILGGASKKGYYDSGFGFVLYKKKLGVWQPWNEQLTVLLRPIVNPVPMYVRNLDWIEIPMLGKEIGYDLMASDWVSPYGRGINTDFIFRIDYIYEDVDEYSLSLTLSFPNKDDGIQIVKEGETFYSHYKLSRSAPKGGYQNKLVKRFVASKKRSQFINDHNDSNNYMFRVRTEIDKDGKIKRAMYGKILREIGFYVPDKKTGNAGIKMHYYLNPDYTRNLEFDPNRNLFRNLPKEEKVDLP